jgi:hypothetical protein
MFSSFRLEMILEPMFLLLIAAAGIYFVLAIMELTDFHARVGPGINYFTISRIKSRSAIHALKSFRNPIVK